MSDGAEVSPELAAEIVFRRDCATWMEAFGWITTTGGAVEQPTCNFLQSRIADVRREFRRRKIPARILTLKPRQRGSTTYSGAELYHDVRRKRTSACVIGAQYSQTQNAFDILRTYQAHDQFPWGNNGEIGEKAGRWSNGSKLVQETAGDGEAGRSGTFQFLLVTEAARWAEDGVKDAKKVMSGILKCVDDTAADTCIIIETTAKAASGDFYERWIDAMDAEDFLAGKPLQAGKYVRVFAPWFEFKDAASRLSVKDKADIEATLDEEPRYQGERDLLNEFGWRDAGGVLRLGKSCSVGADAGLPTFDAWEQLGWRRLMIDTKCEKDVDKFNQDYPESWSKAFLRSGRRRFNSAGLKWAQQELRKKRIEWGVVDAPEDDKTGGWRVIWRPCDEGEAWVKLWERPQIGLRYLLVIDPATGASQTGGKDPDCHAVLMLRAGRFEAGRGWVPPAVVARLKKPCRWDTDILADRVWRLARLFGGRGGCMIVPEMNKENGLVELLRQKGASIYRRQVWNQVENRETNQLGWMTSGGPNTNGSRDRAIDALARAIREYGREGEGIDINDQGILDELESFIVKDNGKAEAEQGKHDDDCMSLAIGMATIESATKLMPEIEQRPIGGDIKRLDDLRQARASNGQGRRAFG